MKKLLSTLLFLTALTTLQAQVSIKPGVGMNFTQYSNHAPSKQRVGFQFGGTVAIGSKKYIEPGIYWLRMSSKLLDTQNNNNQEVDTDLHGIKIPVYVGYHLLGTNNGIANLRIFGGPSLTYITGVKSAHQSHIRDNFTDALWNFNAGFGVSALFMFADLGWDWSLNDIYKNDTHNIRSKGFWFNVGARFPL